MASLTGLAFQIDFLVGRGSRRNAVNAVRDTVDSINLVARAGAKKAARERKDTLEKQLGELDELAKKSSRELIEGKEATAKAIAKRTSTSAGLATKRMKADTSALDAVGKKTVSVAKMMKSAFTDLNKSIVAQDVKGGALAGGGFGTEATAQDFASRDVNIRQQIVDIMRDHNETLKDRGVLTEGEIRNLKAAEQLHRQITDLERQAAEEGRDIEKEKAELIREYNEQQRITEKELQDEIYLRQQQAQAIDNVARSVKDTLRNAFVYATAAVTAFYYKLNEVNQTFAAFENELINAQSIFQTTQDTLFGLSDEIARFGLNYGVELQNASTGLYQLASAGLSAEDSLSVLNDTLTLSMAVQGDHNTISKLTTQTIFGFGLEMNQSTELVDKFAHAINKSLIEYQDLASAVKFAMPFFVSTGQSVDQLLGSLQVLTNRALEAGIAGRGLRQALAEFAEGAEDNTRAFRKMGIEIVNTDGTFKQLTEIARDFHDTFGATSTDVELMTTLLDDLNVRGATAFVHLVQNVDEFEGAVNDLQNSAGSAAEMAEIQQQSLTNQIQILKNALLAPFVITDEIGKANGYMNEFHMTLHNMVQTFSDLIYITLPDGTYQLTELGEGVKTFVIEAFKQLTVILKGGMQIFKDMGKSVKVATGFFNMILVPLKIVVGVMDFLGTAGMQFVLVMRLLNNILPISTARLWAETAAEIASMEATMAGTAALQQKKIALLGMIAAQTTAFIGMGVMAYATMEMSKGNRDAAIAWSMVGGAIFGVAVAMQALQAAGMGGPAAFFTAAAAGAAAGYAYMKLMEDMMAEPNLPEMQSMDLSGFGATDETYDTGGRIPMYDTGGRPNHRAVMVEPGESIISKTMNMADSMGNEQIKIVIEGDVYDGDNFAEKVAEALPASLRLQSRRGY